MEYVIVEYRIGAGRPAINSTIFSIGHFGVDAGCFT